MDLTRLADTFENSGTPLLRTDFSDDEAWNHVIAEVIKPTDFDGSPYGPYEPSVTVFDDREFEGATRATLAQACAIDDEVRGYVVLADDRSLDEAASGAELTVEYVDLSIEDDEEAELFESFLGRTFRCAIGEFASVESNLAIANMDFNEFADNVDQDGVFRGFAD